MTLIKTKAPAMDTSDKKEATLLSKVALNKLNLQAPELGQFVVAFKDLSSELPEDSDVQCGMIILDVKGRYLYAPVIGKNGEVQLLESLFDATSKEFMPLTRKSSRFIIDKGFTMGTSKRIPQGVARDPNLYDAIVPPKTGKFVYASEGRIGGFFATMPDMLKEATMTLLNEDYELQNALIPVMDLDIIKAHLVSSASQPTETTDQVGPPAPKVVTSAEGLSEEQVQEIMSKGYTVINPPKSTKVAVEAGICGQDSLTTINSLLPGTAAMAMKKNGSWVKVISLRTNPHDYGQGTWITEDGEYVGSERAVIRAQEVDFDEVIKGLSHKKLDEVDMGDYGMVFTGATWIGPMKVGLVEKANGWTNIHDGKHILRMHNNVRALYKHSNGDIFVSTAAAFYPLTEERVELEVDINTASMKASIAEEKLLPYQSTLLHRNGVYAIDGKEVSSKPKLMERMLNDWEIDVVTAEALTKSAEEKGQILVKMAAAKSKAAKGATPQEHYEQGEKLQPDTPMTGDALKRAQSMSSKVKSVKDVKDRQVMEATILSEMLQNPDLEGSIKEYLPEIRQAVDKLGRTLFLMRLNTNKLSDSIDAEALNNLFTSTRNAYRLIGENVIQLENLASNEISK